MDKINIKLNVVSDTRSLTFEPSKEEVILGRKLHKENVQKVLRAISKEFQSIADKHDWSTDETIDQYYEAVLDAYRNHDDERFRHSDWFKTHFNLEYHHLEEGPHPETDTLFNLLECCADRLTSSKETSREITGLNLTKDQVYQCFLNTIKYLDDKIEVTL